jgi:lipopolysaccharide export system permease protein
MKLVSRYLLKQHAVPFAFALSALTGIMLVNQIAKRLEDLLGKGLPWTVIAEFFALTVPFIIAMTIAMAVLVAVVYTMSRLGGDREITALRAGGVSIGQILRPLLAGATLVAIVAFLFSDQVLPRTNHRLRTLMTDIYRTKPTFSLKEHVINEVQKGRLALRAARIDQATYRMLDVTVYDLSNQNQRRVIYADSGQIAFVPNQEDLNLTLYDGTIHEFDRSDPQMFQKIGFQRDQIIVRGVGSEFSRRGQDTYRGDREMGVCELAGVVQIARRDEWLAARRADAVRLNGLRSLVNLPPLLPDTSPPEAGPPLYCRALGTAGGFAKLVIAKLGNVRGAAADTVPDGLMVSTEEGTIADDTTATVGQARTATTAVQRPPRSVTRAMNPETRVRELRAHHDRVRSNRIRAAVYQVEVQKKYAIAAACVVFVLVGVPLALRFPGGGVGLVAGASMVIFIVPAFWAMWSPNVLFAGIGFAALWRIKREGTVSRRRRAQS